MDDSMDALIVDTTEIKNVEVDTTEIKNVEVDTTEIKNVEVDTTTEVKSAESKYVEVNRTGRKTKKIDTAIVKTLEYVLREPNKGWTITGGKLKNSKEHQDLYMVHSKRSSNQSIRGKIVDIKNKIVVCTSLGYPSEVSISDLIYDEKYGLCYVPAFQKDNTFDIIPLKKQDCELTLHISLEGAVIRLFKHDGVIRYSSHRKINCVNSRCGDSPTFLEMYKELNGPDVDTLFDPQKRYSAHCYLFLMSHPQTLCSSRLQLGDGILTHIDTIKLFTVEDCPFPETEVDWKVNNLVTTSSIKIAYNEKKLFHPPELTLERALHYLFPYNDTYGAGEMIICKNQN